MRKYTKKYFFFHTPGNIYIYQYDDVYLYKGGPGTYNVPYEYKTGKRGIAGVNTIYVANFKCNQIYKHRFPEKTYDELYKDKKPRYHRIFVKWKNNKNK